MSAKRRVRTWIDAWADRLGLLGRLHGLMKPRLTILMYHRVLPDAHCGDPPIGSLVVSRSAFEAQVGWLSQSCRVLPLAEAAEVLDRGEPDRPLVAITFDDGYRDNHEIAAPILEAAGVRATFFVTSQRVHDGELLWFDLAAAAHLRAGGDRASLGGKLAEWKALDPDARLQLEAEWRSQIGDGLGDLHGRDGLMTPLQVADLSQRGHEIGSHTLTHPLLDQLDAHQLRHEVEASKAQLEQWIDASVVGFAYPNGNHDARVVEAVRDAGYRYAVTVEPGANDPSANRYRWMRRDITPGRTEDHHGVPSLSSFRAVVCGLHDRWRR